jgi:adenine-specific DNA-methyltransferase
MRFIGGKSLMLDNIISVISDHTSNINTVADIFSGSGIVSAFFKKQGFKVVANDMMYFSYILNRGNVCLNKQPSFKNLTMKNPLKYLNSIEIQNTYFSTEKCFIYNNYSPNENCNRMYFQTKNAIKIDIIRLTIEAWHKKNLINDDEYFYLLASLISAIPYVSNITGIYAAYLKTWDIRTYNDLMLKDIEITESAQEHTAFNMDANELVKSIYADLVYIDPPYNERQYLPNYHVLETVAKYDYPEIKGITGMRDYSTEKSKYCRRNEVKATFEDLIKNTNSRYILISYNNEGILSTAELTEILQRYSKKGTFKLFEYAYRRYKNKIPNNASGLKEQIYFIEKEISNA